MMPNNDADVDFLASMHALLGMDEDTVDDLLERLDADELQDLTDAVAKQDKAGAEQVIGKANTDDHVNALFRGENLNTGNVHAKKNRKTNDGTMQFAIGDDVLVNLRGKDGKPHSISATVAQPNGPEGTNTIIVKIKGKPTVVDKRNLDKLDENIIGMMGMPNLGRIQQLAGISGQPMMQAGGSIMQQVAPETIEPLPDADPAPDDALGQAMSAFDTLEAALPNITLADLKCVRERLTALQTSMNESVAHKRRTGQTGLNEHAPRFDRTRLGCARKIMHEHLTALNEGARVARNDLGRARKI